MNADADAGGSASESSPRAVDEAAKEKEGIERQKSGRRRSVETILSNIPLFQMFSEDEILGVSKVFRSETFENGDYLITQGDMGSTFYVIMEGEVDIMVRFPQKDENGNETGEIEEVIVAHRGPGDWLGEGSLLDDTPRTASIISKGRCRAVILDRENFERYLTPERRTVLEQSWKVRMYESQRDMLSVYLDEPEARQAFETFIKSVYSGELLGFYEAVEAYRQASGESESDKNNRKDLAESIWRSYVSPEATTPINVSSKRVDSVRGCIESGEFKDNLFGEEHINVARDLRQDMIARFQQSKVYAEFLRVKFSFKTPEVQPRKPSLTDEDGGSNNDNNPRLRRSASQACIIS